MAIVAELVAFAGTVRESGGTRADAVMLPVRNRTPIAAAGFVDIASEAEVFMFRNFSTSQIVNIRLNLDSDNTAASISDAKSMTVDVGESITFGIAFETDATGYKLSVV